MLWAGVLPLRVICLAFDHEVGRVIHQLDQPGAHTEREGYREEM